MHQGYFVVSNSSRYNTHYHAVATGKFIHNNHVKRDIVSTNSVEDERAVFIMYERPKTN